MNPIINHLVRALVLCLLLGSATAWAQVPDNSLLVCLGADQSGKSLFHGDIAAVRLYNRALSDAEIKKLAQAQRSRESTLPGIVGQWLVPKLPLVARQKFTFPQGCTIEAWIHPQVGTVGRIVDKIPPGGSDGFAVHFHQRAASASSCWVRSNTSSRFASNAKPTRAADGAAFGFCPWLPIPVPEGAPAPLKKLTRGPEEGILV